MIHHIKKYLALRSYVLRLSQDLVRRFGKRAFYSSEHVTQAIQRGKFSAEFIAYAHAMFCSFEAFDAHYKPLGVSLSYQELRRTVSRRYLSELSDFDAATITQKFRRIDGNFSESGIGTSSGDH